MIEPKQKPCKSTGKAKGFQGCGEITLFRTYGLCNGCYRNWLLNTPAGKEKVASITIRAFKNAKKEKDSKWRKKKAVMKVDTHAKEHRSTLQNLINKLARLIDAKFYSTCIDCCKEYGKQVDGAHFHSRGANSSLRWNLDNIHSARSFCNQYSDKHKEGYRKGIIKRYGSGYMELIDNLPLKYKSVKMSNNEVYDKLALLRKIIRDFDTYNLISAEHGRELFNNLIGIY